MYNYPEGLDFVSMGTVWKGNQMKQERFIGRSKEKEILEEYFTSHKSEFVAIYGRRRVGKTKMYPVEWTQEFSPDPQCGH